MVVEADVHVRLLCEVVDTLNVHHLLELGPRLHGAVHLLDLQQQGEGQGGRAGHAGLEILMEREELVVTGRLERSHQERVISFVPIEQSQPGEVTATLCFHSNLRQVDTCRALSDIFISLTCIISFSYRTPLFLQ